MDGAQIGEPVVVGYEVGWEPGGEAGVEDYSVYACGDKGGVEGCRAVGEDCGVVVFDTTLGSFGATSGLGGGVGVATDKAHEWVLLVYTAGAAEEEEWERGRQDGYGGSCY